MFVKLHIGYTTYVVQISGAQLEVISAIMAQARPVEEVYVGKRSYLTHYAEPQSVGVDLRATIIPTQPESYEQAMLLKDQYDEQKRLEEASK